MQRQDGSPFLFPPSFSTRIVIPFVWIKNARVDHQHSRLFALLYGIILPVLKYVSQVVQSEPFTYRLQTWIKSQLTVLINPKIIEYAEEIENGWEGCLSVPDLRGVVPRWTRVKVEGLNRQGMEVWFEAQGFHARVIQHEIDHLHGQVFLDRLPDLHTLTHVREYERYWKP